MKGFYQMNKNGVPSLQDLKDLTQARAQARQDELEAKRALERARSAAKKVQSMAVLAAIGAGLIKGKNQTQRDMETTQLLSQDDEIQEHNLHICHLEDEADSAQIQRELLDDEISLTKAWLYSQSGGPA